MAATGEIAPNGMTASVWECFPVIPESAAKARHIAGEALAAIGIHPKTISDTVLMTCELVTNAMVHGAAGKPGAIELLISADGKEIHVEVTDPGRGGVPQLQQDLLSDGGRGLRLVDALASSWGHDVSPDGARTVWFDVTPAAVALTTWEAGHGAR